MISATSSATATDTASGQATVQINQTFDDFLQLLVTQLKNQDPVSPMDPTEFTNQLVSFSQVEQQIHTNQNLEELIALQSDTWLGQPLDYLGQSVEVVGGTFTYDDEPVEMSYGVSSGAAGVLVQIVNSSGTTVYQEAGKVLYAGSFVKTNNPKWVARHDMSDAQFNTENSKWTGQGYHLVKGSKTVKSGKTYIAAVWYK